MQKPESFIGIDVASETFTAALFIPGAKKLPAPITVSNEGSGFDQLILWLKGHDVDPGSSIICLEATGVYAEHLSYFLVSKGFTLVVEAPHKVKRAFTSLRKNDEIDSQQIAAYAYRFYDQLSFWSPPEELLEQVRVLLSTREQFSQQLTANQNALRSTERKRVRTPLAEKSYRSIMDHLKLQIASIDQEIKKLISNHPTIGPMATLAMTVPGVGFLLTANLLVLTQGFTTPFDAKKLASHAGICPFEHQSGSSVYKKPRSRHYGPTRLRKLLYLAAMSLRTHNKAFKEYFLRKVAEGKSGRLVLNNISNKVLKIIFAVIRSKKPFIPEYKSVHPNFLKTA